MWRVRSARRICRVRKTAFRPTTTANGVCDTKWLTQRRSRFVRNGGGMRRQPIGIALCSAPHYRLLSGVCATFTATRGLSATRTSVCCSRVENSSRVCTQNSGPSRAAAARFHVAWYCTQSHGATDGRRSRNSLCTRWIVSLLRARRGDVVFAVCRRSGKHFVCDKHRVCWVVRWFLIDDWCEKFGQRCIFNWATAAYEYWKRPTPPLQLNWTAFGSIFRIQRQNHSTFIDGCESRTFDTISIALGTFRCPPIRKR